MKRIANIVFSTFSKDGRVQRQVSHASEEFDVEVIARGTQIPDLAHVPFHTLKRQPQSRLRKRLFQARLLAGKIQSRMWDRAYWSNSMHNSALDLIRQNGPFDLLHANDLETLPVAVRAAQESGAKVVFDAHEYFPDQTKFNTGRLKWTHPAYVSHLLKAYLPRVDAFTTVSPGLAQLFHENFGIEPQLICNTPSRTSIVQRATNPNHVRIVHHGAAKPARGPERFIEMMQHLDSRYTLELMLVGGTDHYLDFLNDKARSLAPGRVMFHAPVSPSNIVSTISGCDIGIHSLQPKGMNYIHSLPNKLFEFINAGLAIVVGPSPDMSGLVRSRDVGAVAADHSALSLAEAVSSMKCEEIDFYKKNSLLASRDLNADVEMAKLVALYGQLTS